MKNPLRKLVFASLKKHPTQNIAAVLMMSLCFCFVTAATMMYDSQERLDKWEAKQKYTSAQAMLLDAQQDVWQKMQAAFPLKAAGEVLAAGGHDLGEDYNHLKITVGSLDDLALSMSGFTLLSGAWPAAAGEIALSQSSLMRLGAGTKLGEPLTLDLSPMDGPGGGEATARTYRLTGIYLENTEAWGNRISGFMIYSSDLSAFTFNDLPVRSSIPTALVTPEEAKSIAGTLKGGKTSYFLQFAGKDGGLISDWDLITLNEEIIGPFFQNLLDPDRTLRYKGELTLDALPLFVRNGAVYNWYDHVRLLQERALRLAVGLVIGGLAALLLGSGIASSYEIRFSGRRQQIGLIRAIGASRWQAVRLMLLEALMLMLPSLLLGAGLGSLAAKLSLDRLSSILGSPYVFAFPGISVMLWGWGICGFFLCLSALRPMLRLSRKSPVSLLSLQGNVSAAKKIRPQKRLPPNPLRFLARRYVRLHRFRHAFPVLVLSACLALAMVIVNVYEKNLARYAANEVKNEDLITMEYWEMYGTHYTFGSEFNIRALDPQSLQEMSSAPDRVTESVKSLPGMISVTSAKRIGWPVLFLQPGQATGYARNIDGWSYHEDAGYDEMIRERKKAAQYAGMPGDLHPWIPQSLKWPDSGILGMDEESLTGLKSSLLAGVIDLDAIRKGEAVLLGASSYFKRPDPYGWDSGLTNQRKGAYIYSNDAFRVGDTITFGKLFIYEENGKLKWKPVTQTARICGLVNASPGTVYTTAERYSAWGFPGGIAYMQLRLARGGSYDSAYRSLDMLAKQYSFDLSSRYQSQISSRRSFEGTVFLYQAILFMLGAMGLALLVSNTWSRLSVREREISLLRAVGLEGGKVLRLLFGESIRDGLWAAAIGTVLGVIACAQVNNLLLSSEDMAAGRQGIAFYLSLAKGVPLTAPAIALVLYPLTGLAVSTGWIKRMTADSIVAGIRQVE